MTVEFELEGQQFVGLNGGPMFKFTEAISFVVNCENKKRSIIFGRNSPPAEKKAAAAGSRTNSVCHGRSFRQC